MHWFARPPYLRYAAAAALVLIGLWVEFRPQTTELRPYAARSLEAGTLVEFSMFDWREVPAGVLPAVEMGGRLVADLNTGEPLLPSAARPNTVAVPSGWWTIELEVPAGPVPGQEVMVVIRSLDPGLPPTSVVGLIISPVVAGPDPLSGNVDLALVAVPSERAAAIAVAAVDRRVRVLAGPAP